MCKVYVNCCGKGRPKTLYSWFQYQCPNIFILYFSVLPLLYAYILRRYLYDTLILTHLLKHLLHVLSQKSKCSYNLFLFFSFLFIEKLVMKYCDVIRMHAPLLTNHLPSTITCQCQGMVQLACYSYCLGFAFGCWRSLLSKRVYLEDGVDGKRKAAPRNMFHALSGPFPGEISCWGLAI